MAVALSQHPNGPTSGTRLPNDDSRLSVVPGGASGLLRVLLVEDSEADACLLLRELQRGWQDVELQRVETPGAMRAALALASWDLIVSDWALPGFSGRNALEIQKELAPSVPFIIVSGTAGEEAAVDAMHSGARDFVLKDRPARLRPAVERALREARDRVGRRRAEEALRETEVKIRRLAESEENLSQLRTLNAELEDRVCERTAQLATRLKEREVLLQEVHHRVKNNLQVVSSLINMQLRSLVDVASRDALTECRSRVRTMALIHEQLYGSSDYSCIPFAEYARRLVSDVLRATSVSSANVALELSLEDLSLGVDQAIPCGLILNELLTNAQKHRFSAGQSGTLRVEFGWIEGERIRLSVWNDGLGASDDTVIASSHSLGLQLIHTLAQQLSGTLTIHTGQGTRFELTFPARTIAPTVVSAVPGESVHAGTTPSDEGLKLSGPPPY